MTYVRTFEGFSPPQRFDGLPFIEVDIDESDAEDGVFSTVETVALDPVDSDPSDPAERDFTTILAVLDPGWYRLVWRDANAAIYTSDPILSGISISDLDRVRLKIGDSDENDPLLTDDEVNAYLNDWPSNLDLAAANAAEAIAAKFSRQMDFTTDGQSFYLSQRAAAYRELAYTLRRKTGGYSVFTPSSVSAAVGDADDLPDFGE